jgi:hypothetical protein
MGTALETAAFRADDPECLVAASLSCSRCLSSQVEWRLSGAGYDARVECSCRACGVRRTVFITPDQELRLTLHAERPLDPTPRPDEVDPVVL